MNCHLNLTIEVICVLAAMSDVPSYPDILTLNPYAILMILSIGVPESAVITMDDLGDFFKDYRPVIQSIKLHIYHDIMNQCQLYALIVAKGIF